MLKYTVLYTWNWITICTLSLKLFKNGLPSSQIQKDICYNELNRQISGIIITVPEIKKEVDLQTEHIETASHQSWGIDCGLKDIVIR